MPRRRVAERREVLPDPVYNSPLVTKFINGIMLGGKKSTAEQIFYSALVQIGEKAGDEPLKVFKRAIENVRPARRRFDLPSARRGAPGAQRRARYSLDCAVCARARRKDYG
jgi:ribosomal protein S7